MSEAGKTSSRAVLCAAALALAAGWAVGHLGSVPPRPEPKAPSAEQRAVSSAAPGAPGRAEPGAVERFQVPVSASQPSKGPADAIVTIVEWCDLESAACRNAQALLAQMLDRHSGQVRVVFRHFGQPTQGSQLAHEFARVAHTQGAKFWQAQALLLAAERTPTRAEVERHATALGLDPAATRSALDRHEHAGYLTADRLFAQMFGVERVPAVFVNGRRLSGEPSLGGLQRLIDDEIARAGKLVARGVPKDQVYAELTKHGTWKSIVNRKN